ncbi:hypothetical protein OQ496_11625 [Acetobacter suratthaniensis]|uniref:hypothetical protein n=1 Tax=Acetobacter suratthaniensis TaxID=1502841 RepID=UPI001FAF9754|nr:hypothetical protein [Acetobacter suratthaniensis]MCX2567100.1 hypothetical protein [Acetobacter suratthaniensis]
MARKPGFIPEQPGFSGFDRVAPPQGAGRARGRTGGPGRVPLRQQGGGGPGVIGPVAAADASSVGGVLAAGCQADLFSLPLPPLPRTVFLPEEIRLSPVAVASLSGRAGEDGFLYLVETQGRAARLLEHGLPLSRRTPLMLTERGGVVPWLAWLDETRAEEQESGPGMVLRLRRAMVAEALEAEPDHTAAFCAPCYWLSGA